MADQSNEKPEFVSAARRLKQYRAAMDYKQGDVAKLLGVSRTTYCTYEVGHLSRPKISHICYTLGIREDWLLNGNGPMLADGTNGTYGGTYVAPAQSSAAPVRPVSPAAPVAPVVSGVGIHPAAGVTLGTAQLMSLFDLPEQIVYLMEGYAALPEMDRLQIRFDLQKLLMSAKNVAAQKQAKELVSGHVSGQGRYQVPGMYHATRPEVVAVKDAQ